MALSWQKDRNHSLRKRAIAEEIEDQQRIVAFERKKVCTGPSKAELRVAAEQAAQGHKCEPRGEWIITCKCGHEAKVKITFLEARRKALRCKKCGATQRLSEDDLKAPWD